MANWNSKFDGMDTDQLEALFYQWVSEWNAHGGAGADGSPEPALTVLWYYLQNKRGRTMPDYDQLSSGTRGRW